MVSGQYIHITQAPHYEKVNRETGLSEGNQITIRFDTDVKTMARVNVKSVCLCKVRNILGIDYTNPLDVGSNSVTMNWVGFIKMHLKRPHVAYFIATTFWFNANIREQHY